MGYNSTTKTLSKDGGITLDDIGYCLGSTSRDLGSLCTASTIAKWAKFKPIRLNTPAELTEAQRKSVNCGMSAPSSVAYNNPDDVTSLVWTYERPRGIGYQEWYRILDFDGYAHRANYPPTVAKNSTANKAWGDTVGLFSNPYATIGSVGAIQYGDINQTITRPGKEALALGSWYMAAVIKAGSNRYVKTTKETLSSSPMVNLTGDEIATLASSSSITSITYKICLCDTKLPNLTLLNISNPNYFFYPALCDAPQQVSGTIRVNHSSNIAMSVLSMYQGNTLKTQWPPQSSIAPYLGAPVSPGTDGTDPNRYFAIGSTYTLSLKVRLTNNSGIDRNLTVSSIKVRIDPPVGNSKPRPNFAGAFPHLQPKGIYDTSNNKLGTISIPNGGYKDIIILFPDSFYRVNANGLAQNVTTGQKIYPSVSLTYNSNSLVSVIIKVHN